MAENDNGQQEKQAGPQIEPYEVKTARVLFRILPRHKNEDPVLGTFVLGQINKEFAKENLYIDRPERCIERRERKDYVSILQKMSGIRLKADRLCLHTLDEVQDTPAFRKLRDILESSPARDLINYSWFIDNNNLMLNIHLSRESHKILDKIKSFDLEKKDYDRAFFFNGLIGALHPSHATEISRHLVNQRTYDFYRYHSPGRSRFRCGFGMPEAHSTTDFEAMYEIIRAARPTVPNYQLRLNSLACVLRPYQRDAADFLIHREVEPSVNIGRVHDSVCVSDNLFYLPSLGAFVRDASDTAVNVAGGILADEMGLGKTVELLTLILTHRSEKDTKELRMNKNNMDVLMEDNSALGELDDAEIVKELTDELVSKVSAVRDGEEGMNTIKRAKAMKLTEKRNNAYYLGSAKYNKTPGNIDCSECGARWPTKKVNWLPEFTTRNLIFKCPTCISTGSPIDVSATLIVVPKAICHQWYEEIKKHVKDDVKIDMYMGVAIDGYKHPYYFDQCNIVITTYDVLEKEFHHLSEQSSNYAFRIRKRAYDIAKKVITPLANINWWRVCLDEWQMLPDGRQGEVCWQLNARCKWCISGTPLVDSSDDFIPMLRFLELRPFYSSSVWGWMKNTKPMVDLLSQIFWRNSKKNVEDQLHIPPKKEVVSNVLLSPVEMEYYKLKLDETKDRMSNIVDRYNRLIKDDSKMSQIPPHIFNELMAALNSIRWALVTGDGILTEKQYADPATSLRHFSGMTILDVLEKVINRTSTVLAHATRAVVVQLNKLAAHKIRANMPSEAMDCYLRVLTTIAEYEAKVKAFTSTEWGLTSNPDMKQRIHTIANLLEVCESNPYRFSNDDIFAYKSQLSEFKERFNYYNTTKDAVDAVSQTFAPVQNQVKSHGDALKQSLSTLMSIAEKILKTTFNKLLKEELAEFIQSRPRLGKTPTRSLLVGEIKEAVLERQTQLEDFLIDFSPFTKFFEVFVTGDVGRFLEILDCGHNKVIERDGERTNKVQLCRSFGCPLCLMNRCIFNIELKLSMSKVVKQRGVSKTARSLESRVEVPLEEDVLFKTISTINQNAASMQNSEDSETFTAFTNWITSARKCMENVKGIVDTIQQLVQKEREVMSAKSRDGFESDWEKRKSRSALGTHEKDYDSYLTCELNTREEYRRKAIGKMSYVQTLLEQQDGELECPVCYTEIDGSWKVFPCLHNMCINCYPRFLKSHYLECVVCRAPFKQHDVKTVNGLRKPAPSLEPESASGNSVNDIGEHYNIKGLKLTFKMAAVMRNIVTVLKEDPNNKIIVFSAMNSALSMLSQIMKSVDIRHTLFNSKNLDLEDLALFKQDPEVKVLLLPLTFGANGLNLVEANHVFFMEPIPDATVFQQAMGRVYRMSQSRATTIHHMVTKDTIEETIHSIATGEEEIGLTYGSFKKIFDLV